MHSKKQHEPHGHEHPTLLTDTPTHPTHTCSCYSCPLSPRPHQSLIKGIAGMNSLRTGLRGVMADRLLPGSSGANASTMISVMRQLLPLPLAANPQRLAQPTSQAGSCRVTSVREASGYGASTHSSRYRSRPSCVPRSPALAPAPA